VRVLIVEDEPAIARRLERFTRELLGPSLISIDRCARFDEAAHALSAASYDVVMLDLDLRGRDGSALLEGIPTGSIRTIVVSAHPERAIEAFDWGVVDFVPKPFDLARLERAFQRLRERGSAARAIAVRKHGGIVLVPIAELHYVKGAGPYAELVLRDGRSELHATSLEALHRVLPPEFERTHRSYLVRISDVARVHVHEGTRYDLELRTGERLPIGRSRYRTILARLRKPSPSG
jgi:DNA-binding LytR/AlgR family response regulator